MRFEGVLFLLLLTGSIRGEPTEQFMVVASQRFPENTLTWFQLRNLFLGKIQQINSHPAMPLTVSDRLEAGEAFYTWLFGQHFSWQQYWLDQQVKGESQKPLTLGSFALVLAFLERNHHYIGFVPSSYGKELSQFKVKPLTITP
jgi:hypothetical protein